MRAFDDVALKFRERDKRYDSAIVDVRSRDGEIAVGPLLLGHLEQPLGAGRADRYHHDAADLELLQQCRRNMIDAAGDDDLVEGSGFPPAVIAVGRLAID